MLSTGEGWLRTPAGMPWASRERQGRTRSVEIGKQGGALPQCFCVLHPLLGKLIALPEGCL